EGTLEALLAEDGLATLTSILTYHVVPGKVMSTDILGQKLEAATAAGIPVAIDATMGSVMVGGAKVITADIETSNGVIHVIDAVILPPAAN
ncbi:MAG: fasciclin domain-containing protein, partial [Pseudomonadota bacterium]|nr:fasciclin domain-containing protein [Pseudomonadota bacterium]